MQPLRHALHGAVAALLRDAPLSPGKVGLAWRTAVGPRVDRETAVRLEGAVLLVDAPDPRWAREVARATHVILPRLQQLLGEKTVTAIQLRKY